MILILGVLPQNYSDDITVPCRSPISGGGAMLKYLVPRISLTDLPAMIGVSTVGAIIAGAYGVLHDEITYTISPEYFTKLKFAQFQYADFGLGDRIFAATIGFLATWWVGFVGAWFLARRLIPNQSRREAFRQIRTGIVCVFAFGLFFGIIGNAYGLWRGPDADYSSWAWVLRELEIVDAWSFVRVAYIHNSGYLGGLVGLVVALLSLKPSPGCRATADKNLSDSQATEQKDADEGGNGSCRTAESLTRPI